MMLTRLLLALAIAAAPTAALAQKGTSSPIGKPGPIGPKGDKGDKGNASTVPGPKGDKGDPSLVPGPAGPASTVPGPAGKDGINGAPGMAATIAIGTVTTSAPGSAAAVSNRGTTSAAIFDFTLPRGNTGNTGATGATGGVGATGPAGPSGATFLGNVTLTQTAVIAIALGPRQVSVPLTGCIAGERVLLTPVAAPPAGYLIGDASCYTAGTLTTTVYAPLLAVGGSYSLTVKTTVFR